MDTYPSTRRIPWDDTYRDVLALALDLGRLPRLSDGVDPRLVNWPANQRRRHDLTARQRADLEGLPGWSWDPREDAWLNRADELRRFIETHGRRPRQRISAESALAHWLSEQMVAARAGRLSYDRRVALAYAMRP